MVWKFPPDPWGGNVAREMALLTERWLVLEERPGPPVTAVREQAE